MTKKTIEEKDQDKDKVFALPDLNEFMQEGSKVRIYGLSCLSATLPTISLFSSSSPLLLSSFSPSLAITRTLTISILLSPPTYLPSILSL